MPRKPRIEYEGAFYHVITRGNQRQQIFRDAADFQKYHQFLTIYKNRTRCRVYAYALMNNHVHLLLETADVPLSRIMQGLNQTYTMFFNRKYRTVGHLFQGRYKAILCDRVAYLLGLIKYIHHNPVRAKAAQSPDDYIWTSHHAYTGKNNPLGLTVPLRSRSWAATVPTSAMIVSSELSIIRHPLISYYACYHFCQEAAVGALTGC